MYLLSRHSFNFKFCLSLACLLGFSTAASAQQENAEDEALEIEEWLVASMCAEGNRLIDYWRHYFLFGYRFRPCLCIRHSQWLCEVGL